ncbi:hypothetical protein [Nocardiopsis algeriensis]|uniref:Uncharacterized protein n=1 Tax=Nocardiopsis algeriensis TaxID=1478215 RepID=A0A841IJ91_9ACTN|nr:hypothetical protein [Nocardiopsis algeriensis]MBB6118807.1 hypothetical protein [Nocardiopsis algeriensis]
MISITKTTGFAMPLAQLPLLSGSGTAERGLSGSTAAWTVLSADVLLGTRVVEDTKGEAGGFGSGSKPSALLASQSVRQGSGVPTGGELARERGETATDHAETARRRYGAPGECPRKIPA